MSVMSVVPFSNCTCSGYTVSTGNYNAYTNFIGAKLCDALESMSTFKFSSLILTGK